MNEQRRTADGDTRRCDGCGTPSPSGDLAPVEHAILRNWARNFHTGWLPALAGRSFADQEQMFRKLGESGAPPWAMCRQCLFKVEYLRLMGRNVASAPAPATAKAEERPRPAPEPPAAPPKAKVVGPVAAATGKPPLTWKSATLGQKAGLVFIVPLAFALPLIVFGGLALALGEYLYREGRWHILLRPAVAKVEEAARAGERVAVARLSAEVAARFPEDRLVFTRIAAASSARTWPRPTTARAPKSKITTPATASAFSSSITRTSGAACPRRGCDGRHCGVVTCFVGSLPRRAAGANMEADPCLLVIALSSSPACLDLPR